MRRFLRRAMARVSSVGRRSSSTRTCDVLIIGGGVIGSSIALHLAMRRRDLKIVVLERDMSYRQ